MIFDTFIEQCDLCRRAPIECHIAFCSGGHRHHMCKPCAKSAVAHGRAIEARFAIAAVDLSPDNYGGPMEWDGHGHD